MNQQTAIIIIPTYNERENIAKLLPLIEEQLHSQPNWKIQVLVVDDSSPDGTSDVVQKLQKKYSWLNLLINKRKSGLGGAYLKGMAEAFDNLKADVVFEMDADLSHDPKKIPEFLKKLDSGADLVLGSRYIPGGSIPSNWGLHRKFLSVFGNLFIATIMLNWSVRDWTGGYRAIRKNVYEKVKGEMGSARFTGYTFQIGFLLKSIRAGFKIAEVPFNFVDRTIGESKLGMEYIKNTLIYILSVRWKELIEWRIFKFLMVGGFGFLVNLVAFTLFRQWELWGSLRNLLSAQWQQAADLFISDQSVAVALGAEVAIVSNYILNNVWTFRDRKIAGLQHIAKFIQFNIGSLGSIVIQYITMQVSLTLFGAFTLLSLGSIVIASYYLYLAIGVLLGMIWNFSIYSLVIWRKKDGKRA